MQNKKVPNQFKSIPIKLCALHSNTDLQTAETFGQNIQNPVLCCHQCPGIIDHWYAKFISSLQLKATKDNHSEILKKKKSFHNSEFVKCLLNPTAGLSTLC